MSSLLIFIWPSTESSFSSSIFQSLNVGRTLSGPNSNFSNSVPEFFPVEVRKYSNDRNFQLNAKWKSPIFKFLNANLFFVWTTFYSNLNSMWFMCGFCVVRVRMVRVWLCVICVRVVRACMCVCVCVFFLLLLTKKSNFKIDEKTRI